jgi:hypothetical protein
MSELRPEELDELLFRVLNALEGDDVPCFVTGAFPRNAQGDWRTTRDIDVVVHPTHAEAESLTGLFSDLGFDVEGPREGSLGRRLVLKGDRAPVDIWLPEGHPLHHEEFDRVQGVEYRGRVVPVPHPEDYVLRKLVNYYRLRRSTNDLDDAYQVLLYAWDLVDVDDLLERAVTYQVREEAEELVRTVEEDRAELEERRDGSGT